MEKLAATKENLLRALDRLQEVIALYESIQSTETDAQPESIAAKKALVQRTRDTLTKCFTSCITIFWTYLKHYEEAALIELPEKVTPQYLIRAAGKANIVSEDDADALFFMAKDHRTMLHKYLEDSTKRLSNKIPAFHALMKKHVEQLNPVTDQ